MSESKSPQIDYTKVKIKQEKLSPPRPSSPTQEETLEKILPRLFETSPKTKENHDADSDEDVKKPIEPAKTSNEILAELFKVFNAAPPETLLNDEILRAKTKKSKKDKKHKKKSKKYGRSSSDEESTDKAVIEPANNQTAADENKKKHKKSKKRKKSRKNSQDWDHSEIKHKKRHRKSKDLLDVEVEVGVEPKLEKLTDTSDFVMSDEDEDGNHKSMPCPINIKQEKPDEDLKNSRSNLSVSVSSKIVIKSLKDSEIFKEAAKLSEDKNKESRERESRRSRSKSKKKHKRDKDKNKRSPEGKKIERDESSELSLSDEDTYLKEKKERSANESYSRSKPFRDSFNEGSRSRHHESSRDRFRGRWRNNSRSRSRERDSHRSRRRSRSRSSKLQIDKKRLLEIARKNAITMFNNGNLPGTQSMSQEIKNKVLLKMRYGGKTVEDLTAFCKKLSNGDSLNGLSDLSSNDDSDHDREGNTKAFHHPFVLKDRGPIVMNIKNATPIPPKSADQTKAILMQFPVSSGQHHRLTESEWVPVPAVKQKQKPDPPPQPAPVIPAKPQLPKNIFQKPLPFENQQPAFVPTVVQAPLPVEAPSLQPPAASRPEVPVCPADISLPPPVAVLEIPPPPEPQDSIFPSTNISNIDVTSIITKRLNAMRKLQDNPQDSEALKMMYNSQKDMSAWATSKFTPGQFTGSTGANILSAKELTSGYQAWAKRDQLTSTTPVSGGMGMHLLQKMGWRPGEGLGKNANGSLQPLLLEIKLDKRGLVSQQEDATQQQGNNSTGRTKRRRTSPGQVIAEAQQAIESKHPVSLLGELAAKRKWGPPYYEVVNEKGPAHHRNFIFKVIINGMMYQPSQSCNTKKEAKALAAKYCLQQIGVLPL